MILLGFEIIKVEGFVGFNIFLRVWLILVEIGNNKVWFFDFEVILVGWDKK
jgi:hypothetical protein